ncbi:MAG TPA: dicarboxylate/amino acid:cation symporter [Steroidobacteraceae bacterium]|nr:dicarboxylate/amino acid:cation symporter [Steroidobacteraceae bacterium]
MKMKSRLTWFVVIAMIAGPLFGLFLHRTLGSSPAADSAAAGLSLVTTSFLRLIKMIIAPLVFSTLVVGVARMEGAASIARIGAKALGWFVVATMISMTIGLVAVQLFKPGFGLSASAAASSASAAGPLQLKDMLEHIIPSSIVQAMAGNEVLQIVVFSVLFGAAASSLGAKVKRLIDAIDEIAAVILRMTRYVMTLAPIAIFAALAATVLSQGASVLLVYAKFIGGFYIALLILWAFFCGALYMSIGRRTLPLLEKIRSPLLLAFATASSEAAYPQTLERLEAFGVSTRIASFVLPLGYSFNLCGSAMYCTFGVLFIAQIYRIDLSVHQQIMMLLILMVTSKGIAGVPRAALMVIAASLSYFGLPEQGLVFVIAVDHLLDMGRTATNVLGNAVASTLVAKWEGELTESTAFLEEASGARN